MMKRILACAALLASLAATALAGGAQGKETPDYFRKPISESVLDTYTYGENMPGVYTYGGSKRDWINSMAVAPDGRIAIAGYTESSDGTLSDRTKTWRAGWAMMTDQEMNVMWNYCSRSGDADHMRYPVFHADGTLSVVHYTEGKQIKIVRLDAGGERIASKTVLTEYAEDENIYVVGVLDMGYLMEHMRDYGNKATQLLYDWDGGLIASYEGTTITDTVGGRHLLRRVKEGIELCAVDANGTLTPLSIVAKADKDGVMRRYEDMVSLADGGAAACGSTWEGSAPAYAQGIISRWDEKGSLVFEMIVTMGELREMVRTESGFAATCSIQDDLGASIQWKLLEFDEKGVLCGRRDLYDNGSTTAGGLLASTADGKLICAQAVGEYDCEDVLVTVMKAK